MTLLQRLPNILTASRIVLGGSVFFLLAAAGGGLPGQAQPVAAETSKALLVVSFVVFVIAAATDWLDGWVARKFNAVSPWGAVLDPIADKIAVTAAILGLVVATGSPSIAMAGFVILFREVFVSGLREGIAPLGVKLPVTTLAKWKTTFQLVALSLEMLTPLYRGPIPVREAVDLFLWTTAILTLWTGWQYLRGAARALQA